MAYKQEDVMNQQDPNAKVKKVQSGIITVMGILFFIAFLMIIFN